MYMSHLACEVLALVFCPSYIRNIAHHARSTCTQIEIEAAKAHNMALPNSRLPPEIMLKIFSMVDSKKTLASAAVCSSSFHTLTAPYPYPDIALDGINLLSLTLAIHRRPYCAASIHHLEWTGNDRFRPDRYVNRELKEIMAKQRIFLLDKGISIGRLTEWATDEFWVAIMLPCLAKLQSLDLVFRRNQDVDVCGAEEAHELLTQSLRTCPRLSSIMLTPNRDKYQCDWFSHAEVFSLPHIRNIYGLSWGTKKSRQAHRSEWDSELDYFPDTLASLIPQYSCATLSELRDCMLDAPTLVSVLEAPIAMETRSL